MVLILPLPSRRALLPLPVHAVYAAKHPWEAPASIDRQQVGCMLSSRLSQVLRANTAITTLQNLYMESRHVDFLIRTYSSMRSPSTLYARIQSSAFLIKGEANLSKGILFALEIVIVADHPLSNTVEKMPTHTETAAEFLMFGQGVCCVKVVLPKKEMPALSVAIQHRKVPCNAATERRTLAIGVVMDQHGSPDLLLLIGRGIVRVTEEIVKKELVGGVHFVPWQTVKQLAGVDEGDGRRRETRRPRTS